MDRTRELVERIEQLEAQLDRLTTGATPEAELRARRLVIVDDDGAERVVIETVAGTGSVLVRVPGRSGATTGVELFATPADGADAASVGLCVVREGDVVRWWPAE